MQITGIDIQLKKLDGFILRHTTVITIPLAPLAGTQPSWHCVFCTLGLSALVRVEHLSFAKSVLMLVDENIHCNWLLCFSESVHRKGNGSDEIEQMTNHKSYTVNKQYIYHQQEKQLLFLGLAFSCHGSLLILKICAKPSVTMQNSVEMN